MNIAGVYLADVTTSSMVLEVKVYDSAKPKETVNVKESMAWWYK
ncbi:MAG: hypothetical protein ACOX63_04975 [Christensenellales bacterium]|jgi:hypothetical protein